MIFPNYGCSNNNDDDDNNNNNNITNCTIIHHLKQV